MQGHTQVSITSDFGSLRPDTRSVDKTNEYQTGLTAISRKVMNDEYRMSNLPRLRWQAGNEVCKTLNDGKETTDFQNLRQGTYPTFKVVHRCPSYQILEISDKILAL